MVRNARSGPARRPAGRQSASAAVRAASGTGSGAAVDGIQALEGLPELRPERRLLGPPGLLAGDHLGRRPLPELGPAELGVEPRQLLVGLARLALEAAALGRQ